jgi:hypothetical protein
LKPPGKIKIIDKMDAAELEVFAQEYQDHSIPIYDICKKYHISLSTLYLIVRDLQLPMRKATRGDLEGRQLMMEHVAELYNEGHPYWKITEVTGVAPAQITGIARKMGCKMRRPRG